MTSKPLESNNEIYYCPNCNAVLSEQVGFSAKEDCWTCTKCGRHEDFTLIIEESNGDITLKGKVVDAFQKSKPILKKAAKWAVGVGFAVGTALVAIALAKSEKDNENSDGSSDKSREKSFKSLS